MTTSADVPLVVERDGPLPMAVQIARQLREAVSAGRLAAGERLPSSRELARVLEVSRTVVMSAYTQLLPRGGSRDGTAPVLTWPMAWPVRPVPP